MTNDGGTRLRQALAPAREIEPSDAEVERVLAAARERRHRRLGRGGRVAALAGAGALIAASAAAATGLVSVGEVVRGVGFHGDDRPVVKETVVATGVARGVGEWRITTFETAEGTACMKLTLRDPRARRAPGPATSGYCGWIGAFSEFGHGRRGAAIARGEAILFGTAPPAARGVELRGSGGRAEAAVPTHRAPDGDRRYWVLTAPARLDGAKIAWIDGRGRRRGTIDVAHRFAGPSVPRVVASGTAPAAGPWRMSAYESKRLASDGDLYSPEGLPCLNLKLVAPPDGLPQSGGFCGVRRRTPGFTRAQTRYPPTVGRPLELLMYGHAPERADAVEVRAGGRTLSTPAVPGPPGVPGRFWLIARPPEDFAGGHVYWVDRDTGARGRPVGVLPP